ncbi:MAG: MBL fold metallo-hydrolase [Aquificota bacterium]|nr:MAG: MBL fold metallo-hydrolase [Aquificota bacterium]
MTIKVVFENRSHHPRCIPMWGFSCYIPEHKLLFDTGSNGAVLLRNMEVLDITPSEIERIVLSHFHWDHTGGLLDLLQIHGGKEVFLHSAFSITFAKEAEHLGAKVIIRDRMKEITPGAMTTGVLPGPLLEQGLLIHGSRGWVLLTGCAHPGIVAMVETATKLVKEPLHLVMGGFHLMNLPAPQVAAVARQLLSLEAALVAPCHCTGDTAIETFASIYGERCLLVGAGLLMEV